MKMHTRRFLSLLLMLSLFAAFLSSGVFAVDVPEISCELGTKLDYTIPQEGGNSATGFEVLGGSLPGGVSITLSDGAVRTVGRDCYGDVLRYEDGVWTERVYNPLMNRVASHPIWKALAGAPDGAAFREKLHDAFWYSFDRGQYIGSALRAWRSNPVWGIGPGQHSNRWAEFEASPDGVRPDPDGPADAFTRPRQRDYSKHLYEVHSDWTQLLEEYGLAGLALFLLPLGGVLWILYDRQRSVAAGDGPALARALPLGALLYCIVLILHSFGDFSLQMPSIVWLFAFVLSSAVLENGLDESRR